MKSSRSDSRRRASDTDMSRRDFVESAAMTGALVTLPGFGITAEAAEPHGRTPVTSFSITINNKRQQFSMDPRVTLLDLLRERLQMPGTKKGCDHGQCGACTVLVNGRRELSCLSLAATHDGDSITTIEGLASGNGRVEELHPMQAAFLEHDAFQCGYCTPGQICSAIGLLEEAKSGAGALNDDEIRERMSGNICRCGAYPNIVAAIRAANGMRVA